MNTPEPDWNLYRSFLAVLQHGSLSGAARQLGMTQPTLARHIDQLETAIGQRLFLRAQSGLSPTEAGLRLRPAAEAVQAAAAAFQRLAEGQGAAQGGTVRLSASEVVAAERLPPILRDLRRAHPAIAVELVATDAVEDLLRRDADIAIRMTAPVQQSLVARRIGSVRLGFHARRDYLARRGTPRTMADLPGHDLIGFDRWTPALRALLQAWPQITRESFALRCDNALTQLAAIRAGYGIGLCQSGIAARDPDLVPLLADELRFDLPVWIVMHEDLRSSPACRAVFDALAAGLTGAT